MSTEFAWHTLYFDSLVISLQVFADANLEFDRHFTEHAAAAPEPPLYGCLWPSAIGLAQYLWTRRNQLAGQRVLELGCGLGLPSLICAKAGAQVVALDHHPDFVGLFEANRERNGLSSALEALVGSFTDPDLDLGPFSLIVGSDILYDPSSYRALESFVLKHSAAQSAQLILADPGRFAVAKFGSQIAERSRFEIHHQQVAQHPHPIEIRSFAWDKIEILPRAV